MDKAQSVPRVAILFLAHLFNDSVRSAYQQLKAQSAEFGDVFVTADESVKLPSWVDRSHRFDFEALKEKYPNVIGDKITPGNVHVVDLSFHEEHSDYDYCWVIEYDVRFSGSWAVFFAEFQYNHADLLATHVRRYDTEVEWGWWDGMKFRDRHVPVEGRLRAFMPVRRMSRRALQLLRHRDALDWKGHYECMVPSVLMHAGLIIEDIGGNGPRTPPTRCSKFYSSFGYRGELRNFGSMRYRPAMASWGRRKNFLYHPVKHEIGGLKSATTNFKSCRRYLYKNIMEGHGLTMMKALLKHLLAVGWRSK